MTQPTFCCTQCDDATGFYHTHDGLRCLDCNTPAVAVPEVYIMPTSAHRQVSELERIASLPVGGIAT